MNKINKYRYRQSSKLISAVAEHKNKSVYISGKFNTNIVIKNVVKIALGIFLLFACTQVMIPLQPVPITLQTAGALIIGLTYKKREALFTMIGYLSLGILGLPMFTSLTGGFAKFIGPTGGYLIGMLLAVYVIASLREKFGDDNLIKLFLYGILGQIIIYSLGLSWLSYLIGFQQALQLGLFPFIISGIVKCLFTASSVRILLGRR